MLYPCRSALRAAATIWLRRPIFIDYSKFGYANVGTRHRRPGILT